MRMRSNTKIIVLLAEKIVIFTLLIFLLVPAIYTAGPALENWLYPVLDDVVITKVDYDESGAYVYATFHKQRQCKTLIRLWWKDSNHNLIDVVLRPNSTDKVVPRPTGTHKAGPIWLPDVTDITDTYATAEHVCHPLWNTYSKFY